ncbi:hypothetical protein AB3X96_38005 [Paraburkholderia sp. BR13439]|uniref:hypothetical protein n=1 Tax=unclassified Paraburkholderia TaxID=2615204 RepID=UPI0034CF7826
MTIALQLRSKDTLSCKLDGAVIAFIPEDNLPGIETALINSHQLEQLRDVLASIPHKINLMDDSYEAVNGATW